MSVLSSISELKSNLNKFIKTNFQQLITGAILNSILHDTIDTLNNISSNLNATKLNRSDIGFSASGINLPAGMVYMQNGVDIISLIINGGGPAGPFNASAGLVPVAGSGTGAAGALLNGNFWRITAPGTIVGLLPREALEIGDIIVAAKNAATLVTDFYSIPGDQELAQILSRLIAIENKLSTIEEHASADQTGDEIRDALTSLQDDSRLDYSAVKDIVSAPYTNPSLPDIHTVKEALDNLNDNKVPKVNGKGLSEEDFTLALKQKLDNLQNIDTSAFDAAGTSQAHITALKDNVPLAGDSLRKLYELIATIETVLTSNDVNLDTIQEIVAFIKNNKDVIDAISTNKVNVTDIVDNLLSNAANRPLSANQGKVLKSAIDIISQSIKALAFKDKVNYNSDIDNLPTIPAAQIQADYNLLIAPYWN